MATSTILLIIAAIIVLWFIGIFNAFARLTNRVKEAWADIDVQLKRRYDLIPNLVNTVKGYATHESSAFENVTKARAAQLFPAVKMTHAVADALLIAEYGWRCENP